MLGVARQPSCPVPTTTLAGFEAAWVGVLFGVLAQLWPWFWLSVMVVAGISSWARLFETAARWRKLWAFISRIVAWWTSRSIAATVMALSGKIWSQPLKGWFAAMAMLRYS